MPESYLDRMRSGTLSALRYAEGGAAESDDELAEDIGQGIEDNSPGPVHSGNADKITLDPATIKHELARGPMIHIDTGAAPRIQNNYQPPAPPAQAPSRDDQLRALYRSMPLPSQQQPPPAANADPDQYRSVFDKLGEGPSPAWHPMTRLGSAVYGAALAAMGDPESPSPLEPGNVAPAAAQSILQAVTPPSSGATQSVILPRIENPAGQKVRGTMGGPKLKTYVPLPDDVQALAAKLQPDNPDAAVRQATSMLKWKNWDKPAAEKKYGALAPSAPDDPKLARLQNTPDAVQQRLQKAQSFLAKPTDPWVPQDYGIFDRSLIPQAMNGFPDVQQTPFPRTQPARANIDHVDAVYNDPVNRALIKTQIARGLPLGGETFYPSLYPVKAEAVSRGLSSDSFPQTGGDLFDNWIHSVAPGSARNSIYNERAVGNFLRNMTARGIPLTPENVARETAAFQSRYGMKLPLMPVHRQGAARVLEQGVSPIDVLQNNLTDSYKIPTYSAQQTGNFAHSWTGDVHEANGESLATPYNPYFRAQGGFGVNEYGRAEQHMQSIASEMGLPTGTAQAARWFGGGELTGLKSPRGDSLDMLERQVAYTLHAQGQPTDPASIRNYTMKLIQEGGDLLPWYRKGPMPDHRQLR